MGHPLAMALDVMPPHCRGDWGWEETQCWGASGWKCFGVGAERGPNGGKSGLREATRTATLYISR